jgi:hypothetical protein
MLALTAGLPLSILVACSSSGGAPAAAVDAGLVDGSLGPFLCGLPVPATCPTTAPCAFSGWSCEESACDGYFVVTDGVWVYYYSSVGGELAGEVALDDASFISCPYGFQPPTSCVPTIASECSLDAGASADADAD